MPGSHQTPFEFEDILRHAFDIVRRPKRGSIRILTPTTSAAESDSELSTTETIRATVEDEKVNEIDMAAKKIPQEVYLEQLRDFLNRALDSGFPPGYVSLCRELREYYDKELALATDAVITTKYIDQITMLLNTLFEPGQLNESPFGMSRAALLQELLKSYSDHYSSNKRNAKMYHGVLDIVETTEKAYQAMATKAKTLQDQNDALNRKLKAREEIIRSNVITKVQLEDEVEKLKLENTALAEQLAEAQQNLARLIAEQELEAQKAPQRNRRRGKGPRKIVSSSGYYCAAPPSDRAPPSDWSNM